MNRALSLRHLHVGTLSRRERLAHSAFFSFHPFTKYTSYHSQSTSTQRQVFFIPIFIFVSNCTILVIESDASLWSSRRRKCR